MRNKKKFLLNSRVALILAGPSMMVLGGCSGAGIGDIMGQDITALASNSIVALTGGETVNSRNEKLDLRTRSPLVIPPSTALQNPGTEAQTTALLGGDWPDDPDVRARAELVALEEERNTVDAHDGERSISGPGRSAPMSVEDLRRTKPNPTRPTEEVVPGGELDRSIAISPEELLARRLDPNRVRTERLVDSRLENLSPQERLMEPPRRNAAPVSSAADIQAAAPEKKSVLDRLRFWRRN